MILIPLNPFPSITAPMYFEGNIPEYANTDAYSSPAIKPKISNVTMHKANPVSGVLE